MQWTRLASLSEQFIKPLEEEMNHLLDTFFVAHQSRHGIRTGYRFFEGEVVFFVLGGHQSRNHLSLVEGL